MNTCKWTSLKRINKCSLRSAMHETKIKSQQNSEINEKFAHGCRPTCLAVFIGAGLYLVAHRLPHALSGSGRLVFAFQPHAGACSFFEHAGEIGTELFAQLGHAFSRAIGFGRLVPTSDGVARTQLVHSHHAPFFYEPRH